MAAVVEPKMRIVVGMGWGGGWGSNMAAMVEPKVGLGWRWGWGGGSKMVARWVPLGLDGFCWVWLGSVGSVWVLLGPDGFH